MDSVWNLTESLALDVHWRAWRLGFEPPLGEVNISTLRGIWGAALHDLAPGIYDIVFEGRWAEDKKNPLYIIRPSLDGRDLECIFIGRATEYEEVLFAAWNLAGTRGYGKTRIPFSLGAQELIAEGPDFLKGNSWRENNPVVLFFAQPVRLMRGGQLIAAPSVRDVALAAMRRVWNFQTKSPSLAQRDASRLILDLCDSTPTLYDASRPMRYVRYSARQKAEVEYRCVSSALAFPEGAGPLLPLFDACQWLHMGKNTILGLGQALLDDFDENEIS